MRKFVDCLDSDRIQGFRHSSQARCVCPTEQIDGAPLRQDQRRLVHARDDEIGTHGDSDEHDETTAADLEISQCTVANHRAAIMKKPGCRSLPALARPALAAASLDAQAPLPAHKDSGEAPGVRTLKMTGRIR